MPALPAQQARCSGVLGNVAKETNEKLLKFHHRVPELVEGRCWGHPRSV